MLLHAIGFEWGAHEDNIVVSGSSVQFGTSFKRTGARSLRMYNSSADFGGWCRLPLAANLSEFYYQFAYFYPGTPTAIRPILKWCKGANVLGGIKFNHTYRRLELWTGNFATKVADGVRVLDPNIWYVVEVYVKIADSGGVIIMRVDMLEDAAFSGDTKPAADADVDNLVHGSLDGSESYFDDLIVHDTTGPVNNSWPNGGKVALLLPSADGAALQWTPAPGPGHYSAVDETPPSGTDYLRSAAPDQVDELSLGDLPPEALAVKAVLLHAWALKGSVVSPTRLQLGMKLGGVDYYSPDLTLGTSQGLARHLWNEHPGGGAFSVADVNGAQLLLKSRA
ncbi:MAG: hypothetical protein PHU44_17580 [Syntrophales bacterium]|nr:hypothetical protein [Syntrophales bacterium]MDD5640021.1 hypothetical protein [Syntrophales bacterium]